MIGVLGLPCMYQVHTIYYAVGTRFSGTLFRAAAMMLPPLLHMCRYNVGLCVDMVRACVHFAFLARVDMVRACLHFAFLARVLTWCALHFTFLARADMVRAALCLSRTCCAQ